MEVKTYAHWGAKGYQGTRLPRDEIQALEQYVKASAHKPRDGGFGIEGSRGVTIFRKPIVVRGIVRGIDENGNAIMYLISDENAA